VRPDLLEAARWLAFDLHRHQTRWDGEDYYQHVNRVASTLVRQGAPDTVVAAGYLHDTVEDGHATFVDLKEVYNIPVPTVAIVRFLTRREGETYREFIERIALSPEASAVKRADLIDNMSTLPSGHGLWNRYLKALVRLHNV